MTTSMLELGRAVWLTDEAKEYGLNVVWTMEEWLVVNTEDSPPEDDAVDLNKVLFKGTDLATLEYLLKGIAYGSNLRRASR